MSIIGKIVSAPRRWLQKRGEKGLVTISSGMESLGGAYLPRAWTGNANATNNDLVCSGIALIQRLIVGPTLYEQDSESLRVNNDRGTEIMEMFSSAEFPTLGFEQALQAISADLVADGNAYLICDRTVSTGYITGNLQYVPRSWVSIDLDERNRPKTARIVQGGSVRSLPYNHLVHLTEGVDPVEPWKGISPLKRAMRSIMTDGEIMDALAVLSHNATTQFFLVSDKMTAGGTSLPRSVADQIEASIAERMQGPKRGLPIVLTRDMEPKLVNLSASQLALEKLSRIPSERILAAVGVTMTALGFQGTESGALVSSDKITAAIDAVVRTRIHPLWMSIARQFTRQILRHLQDGWKAAPDTTLAFDLSQVPALQEDQQKLMDVACKGYDGGVLKLNEARAIIGLDADSDGDSYKQSQPTVAAVEQAKADIFAELRRSSMES